MEVHHHSHPPPNNNHGKHTWRHYVWEFLMLFIAVTLGFFVENQREHLVEHKREVQFIRSFAQDLKNDIYQFDSLIKKRETRAIMIDSLAMILRMPDPNQFGNQAYFFARYLPRPYIFIPNDATMQQLRNAGNLRLIRNPQVADTILSYDRQYRFVDIIRGREDNLVLRIFSLLDLFFDPDVFDQMNTFDIEFTRPPGNPRLLTTDKKLIRQFLSEIHFLKTVNVGQIGWFRKQRQNAANILGYISKEYDL